MIYALKYKGNIFCNNMLDAFCYFLNNLLVPNVISRIITQNTEYSNPVMLYGKNDLECYEISNSNTPKHSYISCNDGC